MRSRAVLVLASVGWLGSCTGYLHEDALSSASRPEFSSASVMSGGPVSRAQVEILLSDVAHNPTHYCVFVDQSPDLARCHWVAHEFSAGGVLSITLPHERAGQQTLWVAVGRNPFDRRSVSPFRRSLVDVVAGGSTLLTTSLPGGSYGHSTVVNPRNGELLLIGGNAGASSFTRTLRLIPDYSQGGKVVTFGVASGLPLNEGRSFHGTFVSPGGKIMVLRGLSGGTTYLTSIEELEGVSPATWTLNLSQFVSSPTSTSFTFYPADNGTVGGSLLTVTGTTTRFIDLVTLSQVGPGPSTPPSSLERGSLNVIRKGNYSAQTVYLGGVGTVRESAHLYDPSGGWVVAPSVIPDGGRWDHLTVELQDGRILLVGGRTWNGAGVGAKSLIVFDPPSSGTVQASNFSVIPVGRDLFQSTATLLADGRVLIVGGRNSEDPWPGTGESSVYIFDPTDDSLSQAAPLNVGRAMHSATLLANGQVLVAGGVGPDGTALSSMEVYDPEYWIQYRFRKVAELPGGRVGMIPLRIGDGRVAFGGGLNGPNPNRDLYVFDPKLESLSVVPGLLPVNVLDAPVFQTLRAPRGDHLLWIGRGRNGGEITSWSPSLGTFDSVTPTVTALPELRESFTVTSVANGQLVVAGGSDGPTFTQCYNKAKVYRPQANTWTDSSNNMTIGRCSAAAQIVPDGLAYGKILITGGFTFANSNLSQSEIFLPGSNSFLASALPSLTTGRHIHGQWTLWDGQVLVSGGRVGGLRLNSSELSQGYRSSATMGDFAAGPNMVAGMSNVTSAMLPNGEYMVLGETSTSVGRCQIFNPFDFLFRDCSSALPSEYVAEEGFSNVSLHSAGSKVMVTGGRGATTQIRGVYVFE